VGCFQRHHNPGSCSRDGTHAASFRPRALLCLFWASCLLIFLEGVCIPDDKPLLLGGLWDLSGRQADRGRAAFIAARKAVESLNSQGGINGRRIELVVSDTKGEPGNLLLQASTLVRQEGVLALFGPTTGALISAIRTSGETYGVPVILTAGDELLFPERGGQRYLWTFSVSAGLGSEIKALYSLFSKARREPIAPLVADTTGGRRAGLWLLAYGPEFGLQVLPSQSFGVSDADVVNQLHQFKNDGAAVVAAWGPRSCGPVLMRSARDTGLGIAVSASMLSTEMLAQISPGVTLYTIAPPLLMGSAISASNPCAFVVNRFIILLERELTSSSTEELLAAGAAWDAVHLAASGLRKAGSMTPLGLRQALEGLQQPYYGVMGVFRPSKRDHSGLSYESLLVLKRQGDRWIPCEGH
jgi:branched-chain amino acid transport system substrate-binding protein